MRVKQMQKLLERGLTTHQEMGQAQTQLDTVKVKLAFAHQTAARDLDAQDQTVSLLKQQLELALRRLEFAKEGQANGSASAAATLDRQSELLKLKAEIIEAERLRNSTESFLDHLSGANIQSVPDASQPVDPEVSPTPQPTASDRRFDSSPSSADDIPGRPDETPRPPVADPSETLKANSDLLSATPAIPNDLDAPIVPGVADERSVSDLDEVESDDFGATLTDSDDQ